VPKLKTHSGTKDRIKISKTGKLLRRQAGRTHFLQKKSSSRKRTYAGTQEITGQAAINIKRKLGI
jgi:large subunit ribosomal protein L35